MFFLNGIFLIGSLKGRLVYLQRRFIVGEVGQLLGGIKLDDRVTLFDDTAFVRQPRYLQAAYTWRRECHGSLGIDFAVFVEGYHEFAPLGNGGRYIVRLGEYRVNAVISYQNNGQNNRYVIYLFHIILS